MRCYGLHPKLRAVPSKPAGVARGRRTLIRLHQQGETDAAAFTCTLQSIKLSVLDCLLKPPAFRRSANKAFK